MNRALSTVCLAALIVGAGVGPSARAQDAAPVVAPVDQSKPAVASLELGLPAPTLKNATWIKGEPVTEWVKGKTVDQALDIRAAVTSDGMGTAKFFEILAPTRPDTPGGRHLARQGEGDPSDQKAPRFLFEAAIPVGQGAGIATELHPGAIPAIIRTDRMQAVCEFHPVGADVLDRCGARIAWDQAQIFQSDKTLRQRPLHQVMPVFARGDGDLNRARLLAKDAPSPGFEMHQQAGEVMGQQDVAASAQHLYRLATKTRIVE